MQELKTLIDKASKVCGSDSALAERLGVKVQVVSMLRHGRTITPETAAELADIAGENVKLAVYQAMIERNKGTRREGALREILGKSLLAGVVGMLLFSYAPETKAVTNTFHVKHNLVNNLYIVEYGSGYSPKRRLRIALKLSPRHSETGLFPARKSAFLL